MLERLRKFVTEKDAKRRINREFVAQLVEPLDKIEGFNVEFCSGGYKITFKDKEIDIKVDDYIWINGHSVDRKMFEDRLVTLIEGMY